VPALQLTLPNTPRSRPWTRVAKTAIEGIRSEIQTGRMSLRAGGLAFFSFLSAFPALGLLGALYGLIFSRADLEAQVGALSEVIPGASGFMGTLQPVLSIDPNTLGFSAVLGLVATLWSARKGAAALIRATSLAYGVEDQRSPLATTLAAILISAGAIVVGALTIASLSLVPLLLDALGSSSRSWLVVDILRWPLVYLLLLGLTSFIYWFAPNRDRPLVRWTLPAAAIVAAMLLLGSWGMTTLVGTVFDQERMYGPLASVATVLLWLYLSSWVLLMGAELSAAVERESAQLPR